MKSQLTGGKIEYLCHSSGKQADFFTNNKDVYIDHIRRDRVEENLCEESLFASAKTFYLSQIGKKKCIGLEIILFQMALLRSEIA